VEARYAGTRIELARLEFALLCRLADDPLRVFTKHELLRDVWGEGS
jgi:DNA-binding response OmpR family regulator